MAQSMSRLHALAAAARNYPAESMFTFWISLVIASQQWERLRSHLRGSDSEAKGTVSIRGKKFVMTEGAATNLSWTGVPEYYVTPLFQMLHTISMWRFGNEYFKQNPLTGETPWARFCRVCWAAFAAMPLLDLAMPADWTNPLPEDQRRERHALRFRLPLYLWTGLSLAGTFKAVSTMANPRNRFRLWDKVGMVGLLAIFGGVSINTAHELIHKPSWFEQALANALLTNCNYVHWGFEHTDGHHENVATPKDPATARLDQTVYAFLPRTIIGSWLSARALEVKRLKETGGHALLQNRMVWGAVAPFLWASAMARASRGGALQAYAMFYAQALGGVVFLEFVNYIEHYGLARELLPDGETYEPVNPTHSWNAPHRMSNAFLYKLQRHSDHHTYAQRPYHLLRNFDESPQLPSGYPAMISLALCPPLFRAVMNPLVAANKRRCEPDADPQDWKRAQKTAYNKMLAYTGAIFVAATAAMVSGDRRRLAEIKA